MLTIIIMSSVLALTTVSTVMVTNAATNLVTDMTSVINEVENDIKRTELANQFAEDTGIEELKVSFDFSDGPVYLVTMKESSELIIGAKKFTEYISANTEWEVFTQDEEFIFVKDGCAYCIEVDEDGLDDSYSIEYHISGEI